VKKSDADQEPKVKAGKVTGAEAGGG